MPTSRFTVFSGGRQIGRSHAVGVRAQLGASPATPLAGGTVKEVRRLVASALEQRKRLLRTGRGHIKPGALLQPMAFLEAWLQRTNDHLSAGSIRDFWRMHEDNVRLVMPGTVGGARTLARLHAMCMGTGKR